MSVTTTPLSTPLSTPLAAAPQLAPVSPPLAPPLGGLTLPAPVRRRARSVPLLAVDVLVAAATAAAAVLSAPSRPLAVVPAAVVTWVLAVGLAGGHRRGPGAHRPAAVVRAAVAVALAAWVVAAAFPTVLDTDPPGTLRAALLGLLLTAGLSLGLGALATRALTQPATRLLVVGPGEADDLAAELGRGAAGWEAVAHTDATSAEEVLQHVATYDARTVLVLPAAGLDPTGLRVLARELAHRGVDLLLGTGLRDVDRRRLRAVPLGGMRAVHVRAVAPRGPARLAKAVADPVLAALLLLAFAPLLVAVAVAVRLDSPGPAVYRQQRVGRHGRTFTLWKFRSMHVHDTSARAALEDVNESDRAGVLFKIQRDPRVTRLGAVLRRYSLDELPQLVNVLRGEMSLVGPRPPLPAEVARYSPEVRRRLDVKPGLTGLWQVSGRSDLSWEETVRLDLAYVDNWSWSQDLAIAARTARAVLGHRGAY